jgi:hypothetical protein
MSSPTEEVTIADLCDLIDWLALTYGDNDPIWPLVHPVTGEAMVHNERLARTWQVVVRRNVKNKTITDLTPSEVPGVEEGDSDEQEH